MIDHRKSCVVAMTSLFTNVFLKVQDPLSISIVVMAMADGASKKRPLSDANPGHGVAVESQTVWPQMKCGHISMTSLSLDSPGATKVKEELMDSSPETVRQLRVREHGMDSQSTEHISPERHRQLCHALREQGSPTWSASTPEWPSGKSPETPTTSKFSRVAQSPVVMRPRSPVVHSPPPVPMKPRWSILDAMMTPKRRRTESSWPPMSPPAVPMSSKMVARWSVWDEFVEKEEKKEKEDKNARNN